MEREGHWSVAEDTDIQTRVKIDADRSALYGIDLPDPRMVDVLEALMRLYTGIFSFPVPIDEEAVARSAQVNVPTLRQLLWGLSVNHVIRYIPSDHATVILLQHGRLMEGNLQLSPQRYNQLRSTFHQRVQTMMDFIEDNSRCRSQFLLGYFGQENSCLCGQCDVCRAAKAKPVDLAARVKDWIRSRNGDYTLSQIRSAFGTADQAYLDVLRELIDSEEVTPPRA